MLISIAADTGAAPYIKAAARDVKAYRDAQKMRQIPVGYSAADVDDIRDSTRDYLVCGGDNTTTIDFFAINVSTFAISLSPLLSSGNTNQLCDLNITRNRWAMDPKPTYTRTNRQIGEANNLQCPSQP